jgi:hypothetical protein
MNNEKSATAKKKSLVGLLTAVWTIAKAFIWIVIGILVLVVGAYVVYKLIEVARLYLKPPASNKNTTWYATNQGTTNQNIAHVEFLPAGKLETNVDVATFTFQYGLSDVNSDVDSDLGYGTYQPWIVPGSNYVDTSTGGSVGTLGTATNQYYGVVINLGNTVEEIVYDTSDPDLAEVYYNSESGPISPVIIQRTTDLENWTAIFTNSGCWNDVTYTCTDSNAPPGAAFYRVLVPSQ